MSPSVLARRSQAASSGIYLCLPANLPEPRKIAANCPMVSGWLLLTGGALWTLNSVGAGIWLGHWLARHNLLSAPPEDSNPPKAADSNEQAKSEIKDEMSPLADEVARGMGQAGAAVRKAEWLSSVCEDADVKPAFTIRTAVRELTGAVRSLHQQVGSIFAAFEALRSREAAEESLPSSHDEIRGGIDLIGRRKRLGGFEPPPPPIRFPYPCQAWVAPCTDDGLPDGSDFFPVQCRHLDKDGVAFYVDRVLPAETFVIALTIHDGLTFMVSRVLSEHAQPDGSHGTYMLQCRFVRHVERGTYLWNEARGAIVTGNVPTTAMT